MNLRNGTKEIKRREEAGGGEILVGEVGLDGVDDLAGPMVTTFGQKHSKLVLLSWVLLPW